MRAYVYFDGRKSTLHLASAGNQLSGEYEVKPFPSPSETGWYRVGARYDLCGWNVELGRRVDPLKEAMRLERLNAKAAPRARTSSPGITGYIQRERAATGAMNAQKQINTYFAALFRLRAAIPKPPPRSRLIITLEIDGDARRAERTVDVLLDSGGVQDLIREALSDRGIEATIAQASCHLEDPYES